MISFLFDQGKKNDISQLTNVYLYLHYTYILNSKSTEQITSDSARCTGHRLGL